MSMTMTATTMTITAAASASPPLPASAGAAEPHRAAAAAAAAAAGICAGKLSLAAARQPCSGVTGSVSSISSAATCTAASLDPSLAWWLSSDAEHAHTACPLRPFAHMVVALGDEAPSGDLDACALGDSIPAASLASASIVHLSDALRRKMHGVAPDTRTDGTVGDMLAFVAAGEAARRGRGMSAGLWGVLGWLVGAAAHSQAAAAAADDCDDDDDGADDSEPGSAAEEWRAEHPCADARRGHTEDQRLRPCRRRPVAQRAEDDPLLVGNEGLGTVEVASVRMAGTSGRCVFALCAHAMSAEVQAEWLAWRRTRREDTGRLQQQMQQRQRQPRLAVVHVAEVSTLHRVAQQGLDALVPPPLPQLEQSFAPLLDGGRVLGPPPPMPALALAAWEQPGDGGATAAVRWLALLVSRHGLVEMAHPLAPTRLTQDDSDEPGPSVALGAWLGESLFSRIHPDDVVRLVRALRLAWDARPDAYYFARLRRQWQMQRRSGGRERVSAPERRLVLRADGIAVANGVVELNVQLRLSGAQDLDWADADLAAVHSRFARVRLSRWPLVLRPARASSSSGEPTDGFVLVAMQPLPEPSAARKPPAAPVRSRVHQGARARRCCSAAADNEGPGKHSISSVASAMTLVGLAGAAVEAPELARLGRSTSCLSCHEVTARSSVAGLAPPGAVALPLPVPLPLPVRPHLAARRRSNIAVGSLGASTDGLAYGTPRELSRELPGELSREMSREPSDEMQHLSIH
ncbi:hypothetical protein LPJ53_006048 [Coemansia erecta]|uniref:Uncharacterized protein n=1 Tax=Coemansia erecta TaxID=147472 RepID=A0A9W7XR44_9FUNG|nr:hypothetical protein LPJ53_006048 [Coemansia erecta]